MEIKKSYLMWIGKEHYPTIKEYVDECAEQGVSKRLPNVAVAESMLEEGTVVFVAHDEGVYRECPDCLGDMECPSCRLHKQAQIRLEMELVDYKDDMGEMVRDEMELAELLVEIKEELKADPENEKIKDALEKVTQDHKHRSTQIKRTDTKIRNREEKIKVLTFKMMSCEECKGSSKIRGGTGGAVKFESGQIWDHVRYNYWLHQPKSWTPEGIAFIEQCECCGGTGRLPEGYVFGCFVPQNADYVLKAEDSEAVKAEMEKRKFKIVDKVTLETEKKRGCGKRKAGGVYVVARGDEGAEGLEVKSVVRELAKTGVISTEGASIKGDFAQFLSPVKIDAKRFRGIKRWSLDPDAEDEADMVLDAME